MEDAGEEETFFPLEERKEDLAQLCEQQKQRIAALERELREKDKELQTFRKHPTTLPTNFKSKPAFDPFPLPKQPYPVANVSGSEFWDTHLENSEGNDYSFEDIAAKGLWILSSGTERKSVVSTGPRKVFESQRTVAVTRRADPQSPFFTPKHQHLAGPAVEKSKSPPQSVPTQLPQLKAPAINGRKSYASASPLKPRMIQHPSESNRIREPEYPMSQGYLRASFKKEEKQPSNRSPGRRVPLKEQPTPSSKISKGASVGPAVRTVREEAIKPAKVASGSPLRQKKEQEVQSLKVRKPQQLVLNKFGSDDSPPVNGYSKQYRARGRR